MRANAELAKMTAMPQRELPRENAHGLIVPGHVLLGLSRRNAGGPVGRTAGQVARHQLVERAFEQTTHLQQLVHLGIRALGLPFRHRLPADAQQHGKLLLRHVARSAQVLHVVAKAHRSILRSCGRCPYDAGTPAHAQPTSGFFFADSMTTSGIKSQVREKYSATCKSGTISLLDQGSDVEMRRLEPTTLPLQVKRPPNRAKRFISVVIVYVPLGLPAHP